MTAKPIGRAMGVLLLVQLAGLIVPFVLLLPLGRDFLTTAAPAAIPIRTAVFLLFANGGLTIGLSLMAVRALRRGADTGALWLVSAGVIMCVLQAVDNAAILSMLALAERFVGATPPDEALRVAGDVVRTIRQWTHTIAILAIDVWIASLYVLLHRRAAVPRTISVFGLMTVALHCAAIPIRTILGDAPLGTLGMPMALGHLLLGTWMIARGIRGQDPEASERAA